MDNASYHSNIAENYPNARRDEARQREHESVVGSLVSSRLISLRAHSTSSWYFGRESKDHETRGEAYLLYFHLSSRVLS
jgi:hypothetical protein